MTIEEMFRRPNGIKLAVARIVKFLVWRLASWAHDVVWREERYENEQKNGKPCTSCGEPTTTKRTVVDPATGRRTRVPKCGWCPDTPAEREARTSRTVRDWREMTTPVAAAVIEDRMGEQFPSHVRLALRAFTDGDMDRVTVPASTASTLQSAIRALGLDREMYAEQRGDEAVLRRIPRAA